MATVLEVINSAQRRLREDVTASTATNTYATLLVEYLNDVISDLNEYDWQHQKQTTTQSISSGTDDYTLTGVDSSYELVFLDNYPLAYWFESGSDNGKLMSYWNPSAFWALRRQNETSTADSTPAFTLYPDPVNDTILLSVFPEPTAAATIKFSWTVPQPPVALDASDDTVSLPFRKALMVAGVVYRALNERGEEMGEPGNMAEMRYIKELEAAVYADANARGRTNEYDFRRD